MRLQVAFPAHYRLLDALRGMASVMVLLNHTQGDRQEWAGKLWLGVQLFFVISGYCIAAATDSGVAKGMGLRAFLVRRARRIAPPYLSSVILVLFVAFLAGWWEGGRLSRGWESLSLPWGVYLQNFSLTQWISIPLGLLQGGDGIPAPWFNPALMVNVYWSLNYEEQFYLVCGLFLGARAWIRPGLAFAVVTAGALLFNLSAPGFITGFFLDYWLQFAAGVLLYIRLCKLGNARQALACDLLMLLLLAGTGLVALERGEFDLTLAKYQFFGQLTLCIAFMLALAWLRPIADRLTRIPGFGLLCWVGSFSYSLYLFHQPLFKLCWLVDRRLLDSRSILWADGAAYLFIFLFTYLMHCLVERPFLSSTKRVAGPLRLRTPLEA